ncbi:MAG: redoxin family protein [Nitrososphaera sp.]
MKVPAALIGIACVAVAFVVVALYPSGEGSSVVSNRQISQPKVPVNQSSQAAEPKASPATVTLSRNATSATASVVVDETQFRKAPNFAGITGYINTGPVNIGDLKGKVVLVDFWTVDCINCEHTMPYVVDWNSKYSGKGLVIVGVHTPEFGFEKDMGTVQAAVKGFGIQFPVLQDNSYQTWQAYGNHYWPHMYLIDSAGYIRYDHIGEGSYDVTENMIQTLLAERPVQSG